MPASAEFRAALRRTIRDATVFRELGITRWDDLLVSAARDCARGLAELVAGHEEAGKAWLAVAVSKATVHKTFGEDWINGPPPALEILPA